MVDGFARSGNLLMDIGRIRQHGFITMVQIRHMNYDGKDQEERTRSDTMTSEARQGTSRLSIKERQMQHQLNSVMNFYDW